MKNINKTKLKFALNVTIQMYIDDCESNNLTTIEKLIDCIMYYYENYEDFMKLINT